MDRRRFLRTVSVCLLAAPLAVEAQQPGKTYRIGLFAPAPIPSHDALREGLRALGYIEGKNVTIDHRYADGKTERLPSMAAALVRAPLDVIVTTGSLATEAVKRTGTKTPVVFVTGDPVALGFVASLARPGGTMTGLAILAGELNAKRMELLKETLPEMVRLAVLFQAPFGPAARASTAARSLGLQLVSLEVTSGEDIDRAFQTAIREHVGAVISLSSPFFNAEKRRLVGLAAKHRLPAMYEHREFPEAGGLMSYGPDIHDVYRRAAGYVDKILKGAKPSDLPVEQPTKFELVINLKTAKALGLTIPPAVLARADQVID